MEPSPYKHIDNNDHHQPLRRADQQQLDHVDLELQPPWKSREQLFQQLVYHNVQPPCWRPYDFFQQLHNHDLELQPPCWRRDDV
jgi:hypothetical protein